MRWLPKRKFIASTRPEPLPDYITNNTPLQQQPNDENLAEEFTNLRDVIIVNPSQRYLYEGINANESGKSSQINNVINTNYDPPPTNNHQITDGEKFCLGGSSIFFVFLFIVCTRLCLKRRERIQKAYHTYNAVSNVKTIPWRSSRNEQVAIEASETRSNISVQPQNLMNLVELTSEFEEHELKERKLTIALEPTKTEHYRKSNIECI